MSTLSPLFCGCAVDRALLAGAYTSSAPRRRSVTKSTGVLPLYRHNTPRREDSDDAARLPHASCMTQHSPHYEASAANRSVTIQDWEHTSAEQEDPPHRLAVTSALQLGLHVLPPEALAGIGDTNTIGNGRSPYGRAVAEKGRI